MLLRILLNIKWFLILNIWLILSFLINQGFDINGLSGYASTLVFIIITHYSFLTFGYKRVTFFKYLLFSAFVAMLMADIYLLVQFGSLRAIDSEEKKIIGSFSNVNVALMTSSIVYNSIFYKYSKSKLSLIIIIISAVVLIYTESRVGFILMIASLVYGLYKLSFKYNDIIYSKIIKNIPSAVIAGLIVIFVFPGGEVIARTIDRFGTIQRVGLLAIDDQENRADLSRRIQYIAAISVISENPLVGIGAGNFPHYVQDTYGIYVTAHNLFLKIWVSIGLGGVLIMLFLLYQLYRNIHIKSKKLLKIGEFEFSDIYSATNFLLILFVFQGQFRGMLGDLSFLFFLGFAYTLSYLSIKNQNLQYKNCKHN